MNKVLNQNMMNLDSNSIEENKTFAKQIKKDELLNNSYILYLNDEKNHYGICKSDYSNTFYLFKKDNTKLEKETALKFIKDYFDLFVYLFNKEVIDTFCEYTAKMSDNNDIVIIKMFKESTSIKKYIKTKN